MKPFFLSDSRTGNWPQHLLIVSMIMMGYFLGQFPLLVLLGQHDLLRPESIDDTRLMAEVLGFNTFLALQLVPFVFSLIALILGVKYLLKRPIHTVFTHRRKLDLKRILFSFLLWFAIMGVLLAFSFYSTDKITWNFNPSAFWGLLAISFLLLPLQTTCEEVVFRGYLFQLSGAIFKKGWISVVFTGVLFGLIHGANPEVEKIGNIILIYYIGTGLSLGLIALMDDGLELTMGFHAANNIFAALIVTNDWQAFQTDALFMDHNGPSFGWDAILMLVIFQPLLVLIFMKVYRWKNWKERLFAYEANSHLIKEDDTL